jgi:hypothetical protein
MNPSPKAQLLLALAAVLLVPAIGARGLAGQVRSHPTAAWQALAGPVYRCQRWPPSWALLKFSDHRLVGVLISVKSINQSMLHLLNGVTNKQIPSPCASKLHPANAGYLAGQSTMAAEFAAHILCYQMVLVQQPLRMSSAFQPLC